MDSPWTTHSHPTYNGGAWPKVPSKPSADQPQSRSQSRHKEEPGPVNYPYRWIAAEMPRSGSHHLQWWREIRASRRTFRGKGESDNNFQVQHHVLWQVVAFRLPATEQKASEWWNALPWISELHPMISCLSLTPLDPRTSGS